jgi:hypothetical protein
MKIEHTKVFVAGQTRTLARLPSAPPLAVATTAQHDGVVPVVLSTSPNVGVTIQRINTQGERLCAP